MCSNGHNFIAKVDSGASRNCISKSLWNRIKVSDKLAKSNVVLTGAGGSKISLLGFVELDPELIVLVEVQAPRDIIGNRKYQLNPEGYLPKGIIPLDLIHSFDKTPRMLYLPILNTSSKYKSIAKGSLLGTFEPIDEEISEIQVTSWTDLERKMQKVHQQLRKKKSYRQARQKCFDRKDEAVELLPDYPENSNVEMEGIMK